jgi:hypothetical protein
MQRIDRRERRAARRHDVLDDQAAIVVAQQWTLDAALQPVVLRLLADQERLRARAAGERGTRDRIRAHRQPAHRRRVPLGRVRRDERRERREPGGPQDRALGVDVVLRERTARERHLADHERVLAQLVNELRMRFLARAETFGQRVHSSI